MAKYSLGILFFIFLSDGAFAGYVTHTGDVPNNGINTSLRQNIPTGPQPLKPNSIYQPVDDNHISFYVTNNRCKPQVLVFGKTKCFANNHGQGNNKSKNDPQGCLVSSSLTEQSSGSSLPPTVTADGVRHRKKYSLSIYSNSDYFKPLLPTGDKNPKYNLMGPSLPISMDRQQIMLHSWINLAKPNLDQLMQFQSEGCIIMSQTCMLSFENFVAQHPNADLDILEKREVNYNDI